MANPTRDSKFAEIVIARDGRCQECGATEDLQAHHVVPLSAGGENDPSNGIALCPNCHARKHPIMSRKLFTKWAGHKKLIWVNFRVPDELRARIEALSKKRGDKSLSATIRYLVAVGIEKDKKEQAWLQLRPQ